jgi:hypothetical protein
MKTLSSILARMILHGNGDSSFATFNPLMHLLKMILHGGRGFLASPCLIR